MAPKERAKAVSLTTSGMYLGSAAAMAALPYLQVSFSRRLHLMAFAASAWGMLRSQPGAVSALPSGDSCLPAMQQRPGPVSVS